MHLSLNAGSNITGHRDQGKIATAMLDKRFQPPQVLQLKLFLDVRCRVWHLRCNHLVKEEQEAAKRAHVPLEWVKHYSFVLKNQVSGVPPSWSE